LTKHTDISALIDSLAEVRKYLKAQDVLAQALSESLPTEDRLRQIEQALETFKGLGLFGGEDPRDLHLLLTLGQTYARLSHFEKAYDTCEKALVLAERHGEDESRAELLSQMGRVLMRWQRWDEALDHLEKSETLFGELGKWEGQAMVLLRRGMVFLEKGDYETADTVYREALSLGEAHDDKGTVARASNSLAVLATIQGDFDEAIAQYESCVAMYEAIEDMRGLASTYHNLGMTQADCENWTAAMNAYEKGFEAAQADNHLDVMANIHLSMAEVMLEMGNSMMVPMCCARALDIYRKTGDHLGEADAYRLLGVTFAMRKDWETAEGLFGDSLRLNEEHGNPLGASETHRDLGKMLMSRGLKTDAQTHLTSALEGFRKLGARADITKVEKLIEDLQEM
jgi:tetratricopeptide (TPR) repeat protein